MAEGRGDKGHRKRLSETENQCAVHVLISNAGISPALNAGITLAVRVVSSEDMTEGPGDLPVNIGQFAPIFPDKPMVHSSSFQPTLAEIRKVTDAVIAAGVGMPMAVIDFKISYRAAFTDEVRETAFRYVFYGPPGDVEWLPRDRKIGEDVIPRFEARLEAQDIMT